MRAESLIRYLNNHFVDMTHATSEENGADMK